MVIIIIIIYQKRWLKHCKEHLNNELCSCSININKRKQGNQKNERNSSILVSEEGKRLVAMVIIPLTLQITVVTVCGRDSVASTATRCWLDSRGIESRWGVRFSAHVQTATGDIDPLVQWVKSFFPRGKAAGAWRWPPITIWRRGWGKSRAISLLPLGAFMASSRINLTSAAVWTTSSNSQDFHFLGRFYSCVSSDSDSKQRLFT